MDRWMNERRRCKEVREAQTGCAPAQAKGNISSKPVMRVSKTSGWTNHLTDDGGGFFNI